MHLRRLARTVAAGGTCPLTLDAGAGGTGYLDLDRMDVPLG